MQSQLNEFSITAEKKEKKKLCCSANGRFLELPSASRFRVKLLCVCVLCLFASVEEMNDTVGKGSSCLAITEKKNQRQGGCIGIFFHLLDWNRRLTKKRFLSKKLLLPARGKQASSKKFKGDEKMPSSKLHLIANENNGGFPTAKKGGNRVTEGEQKHEMRVPSLVARLMGLESIPASQRDRFKKSSFPDSNETDKQGVDLEMGVANSKHESRPQKLQKTGTYERKVVTTRFGAEALQIKSVFSRARKYKHHHPTLASPLKSPRITSGKCASRSSRLIGAATRILEPGLQATKRTKCSLTSSPSIYPPNNGIVTERVGNRLVDTQNQSGYDANTAKSLMGHTSCKNCGNLIDVVNCRPEVEEQSHVPTPIVSDVFTTSSLGLAQKGKSFIPCHENDVVLLRSQEKLITLVNEDGKRIAQSCNESTIGRMPLTAKWNSSRQPCGALEDDEASSFAFKHKTQSQERELSSERTSPGCRISNMHVKRVSSAASAENGTKDFVALNRNLSGRTRMRSPTKVVCSKFDQLERKPSNRQDDPLSCISTTERKRRTPNVYQVEGSEASVNLVTLKQRNVSSDAMGGKRRGFDPFSPNCSNAKSKRGGQGNIVKVNEVVSLTLNSPFKQKTVVTAEKEERTQRSTDNEIKSYFQRPPPLRADVLGAVLQQKLKELRSQDNELAAGGSSKKSTAMILQELISALNSDHLTCSDDQNDQMFRHKYGANHGRLFETSCNGNHLSPGSVLEASFSSSSLDESSGHGFLPDPLSCSYDQLEQLEHDVELFDSATSFNKGKIGCEILAQLVNQIPRILQSLNSFWTRLTESKLTHMKDVILNAELVLGNATEHSGDGVPQLLISSFLLDELDTMASDAMWTDFNGFVGCEESKERSQLKGFLFDCVIEYLESNCCHYSNSVFKVRSAWKKVPLCMKAEMLVQEVNNEIKKWACLAGMVPDEIIEWEMNHSLGKWTEFNVEAFEVGVDIERDVLQILVDEIVQDLVDSKQGTI
ncbi:uncharacterized protein LOC133294682 [Gastrolobium bilobum]|uniref:uncharacterized protein LOC133294682 n=1 Tax=Gastrolobium bilobum TaxID=150636 RepID=UPI002AB1B21C|nr:uncharacterized protein LOC133294682 [Gastrolobium bilobum]